MQHDFLSVKIRGWISLPVNTPLRPNIESSFNSFRQSFPLYVLKSMYTNLSDHKRFCRTYCLDIKSVHELISWDYVRSLQVYMWWNGTRIFCKVGYRSGMVNSNTVNSKFHLIRVPTRTGKPGKMGRHFPVREKSGNFEQTAKVREKSGKITQNTGKIREFEINII